MSIIIGADIAPTESNRDHFSNGDIDMLFGDDILAVLKGVDYRIFNLEVPLTDMGAPIKKCGPNLIAPASTVKALKNINTDMFVLANNHILDQGEQGLCSTCSVLEQNDIGYIGVGKDINSLKKNTTVEIKGKKIGIYSCAEHEFSIAGNNSFGANPFEPLTTPDEIAELKKDCDFVIVLYHGGKECYRYPSPKLQKICRNLVDKGANLVVCQHTHCVGCEEKYNGGTIVYGQGNFLFDRIDNEFWNNGLLIKISDDFDIGYIPIVKNGIGVKKADDIQSEKILAGFYERSAEITDLTVLREKYSDFAQTMKYNYLLSISGIQSNIFCKLLNKLTAHRFGKWYLNKKYSNGRNLELLNIIECEAHNELFVECLKRKS